MLQLDKIMENYPLPSVGRLSIVLALITLMLAITYVVPPSNAEISASIFGFFIGTQFDWYSIMFFLILVATILGSVWVLQSHPAHKLNPPAIWRLIPNGILPMFTVFALSITLREMSRDDTWWIVFVLGSLLFGLVLVAEYSTSEASIFQRPIAVMSLIALSHGVFLILSIVLRTSGIRLYLLIPIILLASIFVSFRTFKLRLKSPIKVGYILLVCVLITQFACVFYYLFINSIQFGILLTGAIYTLLSFMCGIINQSKKNVWVIESLTMLFVTLGLFVITI